MRALLPRTLAGLALALACIPAFSQPVVLKVAHFLPPSSNAHQNIIVPWCNKLEKDSAGELQCQIYPAMQLGGTPPQLFDQARDGVADLVWTVPTYSAGRYTKSEVFELPFMAVNAKQGSAALWEYTQKHSLDEFRGVKPIFMHTTEGYVLHSNKRVLGMEDLKGMKIRTATRQSALMVAALGATPVQMPLPQVPDAISKGVIQAALVPWEALPATRLHEIVKFHLDAAPGTPRFANTIFLFGINQAKYDSLSPRQKKAIDDNSGLATSVWAGEKGFDAIVEPHSKLARDRGNTITLMSNQELGRWKKATEGLHQEWIREVTARGGDGRKLHAEAAAILGRSPK
jgi:TRAP-type C4-dicarboxylate transport system substrate-binding protein